MSANEYRKKRKWFYQTTGFYKFLLFCFLVMVAGIWGTFNFLKPYRERAEKYDMERIGDVERPSLILDRNGVEIGRMFVQNRSVIVIERIPDRLINALVAQEDQRFWGHNGVDWIGVGRAVFDMVRYGEAHSGASTLSMQLARNAFYLKEEALKNGEGGIERKIVESFVALEIEKNYNKRDILEFYMNRVPFGHNYFGVRAASLGFFGKEPNDMSLEECASLVSCVKNPVAISPLRRPETNQKARNHVFKRMMLEGELSEEDYERLIKLPVKTNPKPLYQQKSYSYEKVAALARKLLGAEAVSLGGFRIHTSIDRDIQKATEESLKNHLEEIENHEDFAHPLYADYERNGKAPKYLQGACLMIDSKTGGVLAHVGGRNYSHNQFDFIEGGVRPLGTAFFPFLYTAAFEAGLNPATLIDDEPMNAVYLGIGGGEGIVGEWGMEIMDPSYEEREITARQAFKASKIAASARLGNEVGLENIAKTAKNFGMELGDDGKLLSRVMMGWDAVSIPIAVRAISAFSTGGQGPAALKYIERIEDIDGNMVYRARDTDMHRKKVTYASPEAAYQTHSMLSEVAEDGNLADRSGVLPRGFKGGVKTGTLHNFSDGWTLGYNGRISCGVWVGFRDGKNKPIYEGAFAKDLSLPVFADAVRAAEQDFPSQEVEMPRTISAVSTCASCGHKATQYCYESVDVEDEYGQIETRSVSTEYTEFFRTDRVIQTHCSVHGQGSDDLRKYNSESGNSNLVDLSNIPPIRPRSELVVGVDPYKSKGLSLAPKGDVQDLEIHKNMPMLTGEDTVRRQIMAEKEATLKLAPPDRMLIKAE